MRPAHLIRRTNSDRHPANVICLGVDYTWEPNRDTPSQQRAGMIRWVAVGFSGESGAYGVDHWAEGSTADEWWDAVECHVKRRGATSIYCERADTVCSLLALWDFVESGRIDLCGTDERDSSRRRADRGNLAGMRIVLESPLCIIEAKVGGAAARIKILDVANFGLQPSADGVSAADQCARIAAFVRGMVAALKSRRMGSLNDTVASQAGYSFRRAHLTHAISVHNDAKALNIESDSYYGGRCEAFRVGRVCGPVYHLDVSAMYPYIAANTAVPVSLAGVLGDLGAGDQPQLGAGCGLIADVLIDTDEPAYPYRDVRAGVTYWPVGQYRTVLAGPELHDAEAAGRILRWYRASWYDMAPALSSYARCVLDMRDEYAGNDDLKTWIKGLGVSLIGKLGQRDRRWVDASSNVFHRHWDSWWEQRGGGEWCRYRSIAGYCQREETGLWSYDAVPAVASWVCSAARTYLLRLIRVCGWEDCYYCDTDALMVSQTGYSRLLDAGLTGEGEPGKLRIKNVSDEVEIHGIKAYDEDGRSVRLGRPLSVARAVAGEVWYWANRAAIGACREGRPPDARRISIRHDRTDTYRHGLVCADGTVTPFQLNQE